MRRERRVIAIVAVLALLGGACSGSRSAPTTTTTGPVGSTSTTVAVTSTTTTIAPAVMPTFADDDERIELDPATIVGKLDNGLTYFIRENQAPGGRAQLRLVVAAGSVNESDTQPGVAHFLEHMMFNGTEAFPSNELVAVLQRFGAEFGPDINAYTSYEETVYQLQLPTDDPDTVATGFDVLFQWATAATIDPDEVGLERGVLVEEWRLRDQGFWGRYFAMVPEILFAGSPYSDRGPLGTPVEVDATSPDTLRSFYEDWYRPDLMAVVAVGDFEADDIEAHIVDRFGDLPNPQGPAKPDLFTLALDEPEFLIMADPEATDSFVEINYPVPVTPGEQTVGALRRTFALHAAFEMLVTRLHEDTLRGLTPFFDPSHAANDFVSTHATSGLAASAAPGALEETAGILLNEVERARRHGFNQSELDRVVASLRAAIQTEYAEERSRQDGQFADAYADYYLGVGSVAEARAWRDLRLRLVDELTLEQVRDTFAATIEATNPLIIVAGPETSSDEMPDDAALAALLDAAAIADLEPRADDGSVEGDLMGVPQPADVVDRTEIDGTTLPVLEFENGLRFAIWPTDIHAGHAELLAASPGGWSSLSADEVTEGRLLGDIMLASGVAEFDQITLDRLLAGTNVSLFPYMDEAWQGFSGSADTTDLETLFQLVHLYMTQPRFDEVSEGIIENRLHQQVESPETLVDTAFALASAEARFGDDPRYRPIPTPEELAGLDVDVAAKVFDDHFGDPSDFVFVLVGDFTLGTAEYLARRYLGTIEGTGEASTTAGARPAPPAGIVVERVEAGSGERGVLGVRFSSEGALTPDDRVHLDLLEAVIQQRLTTNIRESLSASYSPFVTIDLIEDPIKGVEVAIRTDGDPAKLDVILQAMLIDLEDLLDNGPTADEFAIAQDQVFRNYELFNNPQLARAMIFSIYHPKEMLLELITRFDRVDSATRTDIRNMARRVLTIGDRMEIHLVPIGSG